jgi:hypothetical protein
MEHSSLLVLFVSYEENEVFLISPLAGVKQVKNCAFVCLEKSVYDVKRSILNLFHTDPMT